MIAKLFSLKKAGIAGINTNHISEVMSQAQFVLFQI